MTQPTLEQCPACSKTMDVQKSGSSGHYIYERFCAVCEYSDTVHGELTLGAAMGQVPPRARITRAEEVTTALDLRRFVMDLARHASSMDLCTYLRGVENTVSQSTVESPTYSDLARFLESGFTPHAQETTPQTPLEPTRDGQAKLRQVDTKDAVLARLQRQIHALMGATQPPKYWQNTRLWYFLDAGTQDLEEELDEPSSWHTLDMILMDGQSRE